MIRSNWVLDPGKFLTGEEVSRLLERARKRAEAAIARGRKVAVRDWFIVDLALSTGLRVAEIADLKCKDIFLREQFCALLVRNGKGGKTNYTVPADDRAYAPVISLVKDLIYRPDFQRKTGEYHLLAGLV